jgi:multiple sugar transport system ATP-binding protein
LLVHLRLDDTAKPFIARFPPRSTVRIGDAIKIAVDIGQLHFFDTDSGDAIDGTVT